VDPRIFGLIAMGMEFCAESAEATEPADSRRGRPVASVIRVLATLQQFLRLGIPWRELKATPERVSGATLRRLWRSLKWEEVYLDGYANGLEARIGIGQWIRFYNERRPHQTLGYRTPAEVWACPRLKAGAGSVDMPLRLDDAVASPAYPQGQPQQHVVNL
jgi:hypothetical protein